MFGRGVGKLVEVTGWNVLRFSRVNDRWLVLGKDARGRVVM